jgi:PTH1 family peptidyl-tRNA hydrolase
MATQDELAFEKMYLFVGLGNPGPSYAMNRHNFGFMAVDVIADSYRASPWKSRFQGHVAEVQLGDHRVLLCKPLTYMNLSGRCVGEAMRFYKIPLDSIYVFHDDLDLDPGKVKLKNGGGTGGHNGLASLEQHIGRDYWRVRLGIGHPGHKDAVTPYVLSNFSRKEEESSVIPLLHALAAEAPTLPGAAPASWIAQLNKRLV